MEDDRFAAEELRQGIGSDRGHCSSPASVPLDMDLDREGIALQKHQAEGREIPYEAEAALVGRGTLVSPVAAAYIAPATRAFDVRQNSNEGLDSTHWDRSVAVLVTRAHVRRSILAGAETAVVAEAVAAYQEPRPWRAFSLGLPLMGRWTRTSWFEIVQGEEPHRICWSRQHLVGCN